MVAKDRGRRAAIGSFLGLLGLAGLASGLIHGRFLELAVAYAPMFVILS